LTGEVDSIFVGGGEFSVALRQESEGIST
jgi:hypothetical protein